MELQAVHAIFKNGRLIFSNLDMAPKNDSEVLVTFIVRSSERTLENIDPIQALRGRGKGDHLVEKLLKSRNEDRNRNGEGVGLFAAGALKNCRPSPKDSALEIFPLKTV